MENAIEKARRIASQLEAIADWEDAKVCQELPPSRLLREAAKMLVHYSRYICGQGFICSAGANCNFDHK